MIHATTISKIMTMRNLLGNFWVVILMLANKKVARWRKNHLWTQVQNMHDKLFSKLLSYHELLVTIVINWIYISSKDWKNNVILIMGKLPRLGFWLSHLFLRQRCQAMVQRRETGKTQGSYWVNKLKSCRRLRWLSL